MVSGIQNRSTSIPPDREEEGMGYYGGGVTMGKCFYCMLLAPPPRRALLPHYGGRSAIFLRRFRASRPRPEMLRGAHPSPQVKHVASGSPATYQIKYVTTK